MALLPYAGFAADGDITEPSANDLTYSGAAQALVSGGDVAGASYEMRYAMVTSATATPAASDFTATVPTGIDAGTYYVFFVSYNTATETLSEIGAKVSVTIAKKGLEAGADKDYVAPTAVVSLTYNGSAQTLIAKGTLGTAGSAAKCGTFSYAIGDGDYTYTDDNLPAATDAKTSYTVKWKLSGSANYKEATGTVTVAIAQKAFSAANLTIAVSNNTKWYNGRAQSAKVTVTDTELETALATTDYGVTYSGDCISANSYTITVTGTGTGNYTNAAITLNDTDDPKLVINKAQAYVEINDAEMDYDGEAYNTTDDGDFTFTYSGFKNGETSETVTITNSATVTGYNDVKAAGTHKVLTFETITNNIVTGITADNYEFLLKEKGTLTINKVDLTIALPTTYTADVNQKAYGAEDPDFNANTWKTATNVTLTGVVNSETNAILGELVISRTNADVEAAGTYEGVLTATPTPAGDATELVTLANYNYTITPGNFKIASGTLYIGIDDQELTYTGEAATLSALTIDKLKVTGLSGSDTEAGVIGDNIPTLVINEGEDAINVGYYDIELDGLTTLGSYDVVYINGQLHIQPAEVTVSFTPQTLAIGATVADELDTELFKVTGMVNDEDATDIFKVAVDDAVVESGNIKTGSSTGQYLKLAAVDATLAANYTGWETATGKLVIAGTGTLVLTRTDAVQDVIENATTETDVTFGDRSLAAETWNSFVLPFDIKVSKLSAAFGYAIVNTLNTTTSTGSEVHFKLEMGTIPANTPFLMKTAEAINTSDVTIEDVQIVKPATWTVTVGEEGAPQFVGLYERTEISNALWSFPSNAADGANWVGGASGVYLNPLAAYLVKVEANAPIFIEDIEGNTTVIKQIGVDGTSKAYSVDGWYTLNGVKLNAAPTTKGIYINNGKKVVIK